jgi:hypothetical protein
MATVNAFLGNWSYRSYENDPNFATQPNDLLFGMGTLNLAESADGKVAGSLGGTGWSLRLAGDYKPGDPHAVRFQGTGEIGGEPWVYDYLGYLVPDWPDGIAQRAAIVGSVIRTIAHNNGQAPAGFVASFIAVKQD